MTPKGKKVLIISSIIFLIVAIGVVVFFIIRAGNKKKEEEEKKKKEEKKEESKTEITDTSTSSGSGSGSGGGSSVYTFPFKTVEEGNKFRAWINDKYPTYAKEIDLSRTGQLNSYVQRAWEKHGTEYTAYLTGGSGATVTPSGGNANWNTLAKAINDLKSRTARVVGDEVIVDLFNNYGNVQGSISFLQSGSFYGKYGSNRTAKGTFAGGGTAIRVKEKCEPGLVYGMNCSDSKKIFTNPDIVTNVNSLSEYIKKLG